MAVRRMIHQRLHPDRWSWPLFFSDNSYQIGSEPSCVSTLIWDDELAFSLCFVRVHALEFLAVAVLLYKSSSLCFGSRRGGTRRATRDLCSVAIQKGRRLQSRTNGL